MFCPKCGKDCGEFEFCPQCGTELPKAESAAVQPAWSVGMACPHCGGTELKGNNCAFCGALLKEDFLEKECEQRDYDNIPFGAFTHGDRFLKFDKNGVYLINVWGNEYRIPYSEITDIFLSRNTFIHFGWISFKWAQNQHLQLPLKYGKSYNHDATFHFTKEQEPTIQQIYYAIREILKNKRIS